MARTPWDRLKDRIRTSEEQAERQPDQTGFRACQRIEELWELQHAITHEIDREIVRAREQGATWGFIGAAFRTSKQGAQYRYQKAVQSGVKAT